MNNKEENHDELIRATAADGMIKMAIRIKERFMPAEKPGLCGFML